MKIKVENGITYAQETIFDNDTQQEHQIWVEVTEDESFDHEWEA